jgi:hypothetical protein
MKRKIPYQSYFFPILFFVFSCNILNNQQKKLFTVKDAYYQSWIVDEQNKGTTITIVLSEIDNSVNFDSLVFRGIQMPVDVESKDGTSIIKSTYSQHQNLFIEKSNNPTFGNDALIYTYKGEKKYYKLESIRREDMKYNKRN